MSEMTSSKLATHSHLDQYGANNLSKLTENVVGLSAPQVAYSSLLHDGLERIPDNVNQPGLRRDSKAAAAKSLKLAVAERKKKEPTTISALINTSDSKLTIKR